MRIFGSRITMARQLRGMPRYQLARKVNLRTAELRELERVRRNKFPKSIYYGEVLDTEAPDHIIEAIGLVVGFPVAFFQDYNDPEEFQPRFVCRNPDETVCDCGKQGTRLCDAIVNRQEPIFNDPFNKIILGYESVQVACDAPICDDCTYRKGEADYCSSHDPRPFHKRTKAL